eukprot:GHVU01144860.1.p1 GENE.GHVU01144860.1~~GHVU01144860.1.p1  ORF type:complete len:369 (-),score=44.99 GHVU01144860.1:378-1454(-)
MKNTSEATSNGLSEWANSGIHFATTEENPDAAVMPENWELAALYDGERSAKPLCDIVEVTASQALRRAEQFGGSIRRSLCDDIRSRGHKIGADISAVVSGQTEECEREMCVEEEEEEEAEREIMQPEPISESVWDYSAVLGAMTVTDIRNKIPVKPFWESLSDWAARSSHGTLKNINRVNWKLGQRSSAGIYCTQSFLTTVKTSSSLSLRLADALLIMPDQSVLLLTDREADGVLQALWQKKDGSRKPAFVSLSRMEDVGGDGSVPLTVGQLPLRDAGSHHYNVGLSTRLRLWNGHTKYGDDAKRVLERDVLPSRISRDAARQLVDVRGANMYMARSDLEAVCDRWCLPGPGGRMNGD